jgi:uncharacterized protein (UPF0335 family)
MSDEPMRSAITTEDVSTDQLRSFIERIERLEEEKKGVSDDIKDIYNTAKDQGFDAKILRRVIALRKKSSRERREEEELLEIYLKALGDI